MKIKLLIISLFITLVGLQKVNGQKTINSNAWEEDYEFEALADQADGGSVSIDITNTGGDIQECISKAKSHALFKIIFKGYPASNRATASTALIDLSNYNQNLDFFKNYLSSNTAGLAFVNKANTNTSKPGGKVDKKTIKSTTTVYILKTKLREDLQKQGYVESAKDIAESMGILPTVMIVPSNTWMKSAGFHSQVESDMGMVDQYDYQNALSDPSMVIFQTIEGYLKQPLQNNGFKIANLSAQIQAISAENAYNSMRNNVVQESAMDLLAKQAAADIWLNVSVLTETVSGGVEKQYQITLNGVDPLTMEDVINGTPQLVKSAGDNDLAQIRTTINAAIDNLIPEITKYFKERDENGIPGKIYFMMGEDVSVTFDDELEVDGDEYAFAEIVDAMVSEQAKKSTAIGRQTPTRRDYDVIIPTKMENKLSGKVEPFNYEKFARKVKAKVKKIGGLKATVETVGLGKVYVIFTEEL